MCDRTSTDQEQASTLRRPPRRTLLWASGRNINQQLVCLWSARWGLQFRKRQLASRSVCADNNSESIAAGVQTCKRAEVKLWWGLRCIEIHLRFHVVIKTQDTLFLGRPKTASL